MIKIAILGFGTVGSGVYEVLRKNAASAAKRAGESGGAAMWTQRQKIANNRRKNAAAAAKTMPSFARRVPVGVFFLFCLIAFIVVPVRFPNQEISAKNAAVRTICRAADG